MSALAGLALRLKIVHDKTAVLFSVASPETTSVSGVG